MKISLTGPKGRGLRFPCVHGVCMAYIEAYTVTRMCEESELEPALAPRRGGGGGGGHGGGGGGGGKVMSAR